MPHRRCERWFASMPPASHQLGDPSRTQSAHAALREDPKGPYTNVMVARSADMGKPWVKTLVRSCHTPVLREFVLAKLYVAGSAGR